MGVGGRIGWDMGGMRSSAGRVMTYAQRRRCEPMNKSIERTN